MEKNEKLTRHSFKQYTELPTQERLLALLDYDPVKGTLIWKRRLPEDFQFNQFPEACAKQFNKMYAGMSALVTMIDQTNPKYGYQIVIEQKGYSSCRIAWKMHYGHDPDGEVFALNGDKRLLYIDNLSCGTFEEPHRNSKNNALNTSGVKGVYWNKEKNKWQAQIQVGGVVRALGRFTSLDDAAQARRNAEIACGYRTAKHVE